MGNRKSSCRLKLVSLLKNKFSWSDMGADDDKTAPPEAREDNGANSDDSAGTMDSVKRKGTWTKEVSSLLYNLAWQTNLLGVRMSDNLYFFRRTTCW